VKKTGEERSMSEHNFTVLRKNRTGKALRKDVDDHEVGPERNKLHNTSSIKLAAKKEHGCQCGEKISSEQD
jgi:hypothetical protein